MQNSHFLKLAPAPDGTQTIVGQGIIGRALGKENTHFLCRTMRKGYTINQVLNLDQLSECLIFEDANALNAFLAENVIPPKAPESSPKPLEEAFLDLPTAEVQT